MAVYRQIQITFWQDKFVLELTPEEKFFYIYLLTNSKTKQCGIYELPFQIIQFETGYNLDTVKKLIKKFVEMDKIIYDYETDEIALLNWRKYNDSTSHKTQVCVMGELSMVKSQKLINIMGYSDTPTVTANKNYRISDKLRKKILERDNYKCLKCGSTEDLTIDHIFPRSLGGKSDEFNLRTLCRSCNSKRILIGEELKLEILRDGFDYKYLENAYQYPIGGETQEEKEEEKEQPEKEEELETARLLWISIFTNNPGVVEKEFVAERIKAKGFPYARKLFRDFRELGFHKVRTMKESLDENGEIKPKSTEQTNTVLEIKAV